MNAHTYMIIVV